MRDFIPPEAEGFVLWTSVGSFWWFPLCCMVAVNLLAFALMGIDKRRAKREGKRRIPERTLFLAALLGGSIGAIAGMQIFRHKTKHWYFVWGMPAILAAQAALALWWLLR